MLKRKTRVYRRIFQLEKNALRELECVRYERSH